MAARYWVGGSNTWNSSAGAKWSATDGGTGGASTPGSSDTVFFTALSGPVTVTWASGASPTVLSITCTGFTGTLATDGNSKTLAGTGAVWTSPATCTITGAPTLTVSSTGATAISVTCDHASPSATNAPNFSFTGGTYPLTINGTGFRQLIWSPSGVQTITGTVSVYGFVGTNHIKNFSGLNITFLATATFDFNNGNSTIAQFPTLGDITINAPGGTVSLDDNVFPSPFTLGTTKTLTLTAGTFSTGGRPVSTGRFSSNNGNTRVYSTESGSLRVQTIELTSTTAATTVLDMANATGFSFFTSPDSTLRPTFVRNQAATATMVFGTTGGTTTNACNLTVNAGASALTITSGSYFRLVNFTGSTCTVTGGYNATSVLTLASGGTYTSFSPTFVASTSFTSAGKTLGGLTINGSGITVGLGDAITLAGIITLTQGTFTTNNHNVTAYNFSSGGSLTKTLNMGSSTWTLSGQYSGPDHWSVSFATNLTINAGTSTIDCVYTGAGTNSYFNGGGFTYYNLKHSGTQPTVFLTIRGSNTFNDLINGNTTRSSSFAFEAGTTQTFTNFTYTNTAPHTSNFKSLVSGSTFTLSKASGTVNLSRMTIQDAVASGGATWNATESVNLGNNTGWNFTAPTGRYWVGGTASWDDTAGSKWATTSGGAGGASIPGIIDPVYLNAASGAATVTIATGNAGCAGLVCTGFTGTLTGTDALSVSGNVTLVSGMTYTYTGLITLIVAGTITSAGKTFGSITVNAPGVTVTLADALTLGITNTFTLTQGTLALENFNLSTGIFSSSNSNTRAISFGSGNIALTSTTASALVLNIDVATNFTWTGTGGFTRNQAATASVSFSGATGGTTSNAPNLTVNAGASALNIVINSWFKNLIFTGSTCTVTTSTVNIAGNLTLATGGTYTAVIATFRESGTITSATKTLGNTTINGAGITVTLADTMTVATTSTTTLTAGTLALAGFTLSTGAFSSSNSNTRAISFGSGNIALTSTTAAATVLSMNIASNFTWTGTGGFTRNQSATATVVFGTSATGNASNAPNLTINAGASALTITGGSWFKNLVFTGSTSSVTSSGGLNIAGNLTVASGGSYSLGAVTYRASGTITSLGKIFGANQDITGSGIIVTLADALTTNATFTLTQGTLNLAGFTLSAGNFSSNNSNTRAISFGSGSITCTSTGTVWDTGTVTSLTVTGTPLVVCTNSSATARTITPGSLSEANSISFRVTAGTGTLGLTAGAYRNLDFTDGTNPTGYAGALTGSTSITIYGDLKASTNMTVASGSGVFTFAATSGTKTINTASVTFDKPFTFNGVGGTWILQNPLVTGNTRTVSLTAGTLNLGSYALTTGFFAGSGSGVRSLITGGVPITLTGDSGTVIAFGTFPTNLTVDVNPTFDLTYAGSTGTRGVSFGSISNAIRPNINVTAGSDTFAATEGVVTAFGNLNFTGFTGTFANTTRSFEGNLTLVSGMTLGAGNLVSTFIGSGSYTITSAGQTFDFPIVFDGVGGTWQLQDPLIVSPTYSTTLTRGTLDINGTGLTTGALISSNSNTRTLKWGPANGTQGTASNQHSWAGAAGYGNIFLTSANNTTLELSNPTNMTMIGSKAVITNGVTDVGQTRYFNLPLVSNGATASHAINLGLGGTGPYSFWDNVILPATESVIGFTEFYSTGSAPTLTCGPLNIYGNFYTNITGTNAISGTGPFNFKHGGGIANYGNHLPFPVNVDAGSANTRSMSSAMTLSGVGANGVFTLTSGTLEFLFGYGLTTGSFNSSGSTTRTLSTNSGTITLTDNNRTIWNTGVSANLTFTTIPDVYSTYSGSTGTRVFSTAGVADRINLNITAGSDIIAPLSTFVVNNYNLTGFSGTLTNVATNIYGNLTLTASATHTSGNNAFTFKGNSSVNTNGAVTEFPIIVDTPSGSVGFQSGMDIGTKSITFTSGTINGPNASYYFNCGSFDGSSATGTLNLGGGVWWTRNSGTAWSCAALGAGLTVNRYINGSTVEGVIYLANSSPTTFSGGGQTYATLAAYSSEVTIASAPNTFKTIQWYALGSSPTVVWKFPVGHYTYIENFNNFSTVDGNTLCSDTPGTQATIYVTSPTNGYYATLSNLTYLKDIAGVGGSGYGIFDAGPGSYSLGNVSGWTFGGGGAMMFFL